MSYMGVGKDGKEHTGQVQMWEMTVCWETHCWVLFMSTGSTDDLVVLVAPHPL